MADSGVRACMYDGTSPSIRAYIRRLASWTGKGTHIISTCADELTYIRRLVFTDGNDRYGDEDGDEDVVPGDVYRQSSTHPPDIIKQASMAGGGRYPPRGPGRLRQRRWSPLRQQLQHACYLLCSIMAVIPIEDFGSKAQVRGEPNSNQIQISP